MEINRIVWELQATLNLGDLEFIVDFLVGDIQQDAVLGQDFLLEHIDKIDYRK